MDVFKLPSRFLNFSTYSLNAIPEEWPLDTSFNYCDEGVESLDRRLRKQSNSTLSCDHVAAGTCSSNDWAEGHIMRSDTSPALYPVSGALNRPLSTSGQDVALIDTPSTSQKWASFLSRHFRNIPPALKRTRSTSKLAGKRVRNSADGNAAMLGPRKSGKAESSRNLLNSNSEKMRAARSHESLLSYSTTTHMMDLGGADVQLTALHPSLLNAPHCLRLTDGTGGASKYYGCRTSADRDRWMDSLRRTMNPSRDNQRRTENSLQIWLIEAKGLADGGSFSHGHGNKSKRRRFFCELSLDKTLYARTAAKPQTDHCFWGEQFQFSHLPHTGTVCVNLYREMDARKKKDRNTLIGYVEIPVDQLTARHPVEKWYSLQTAEVKNFGGSIGSVAGGGSISSGSGSKNPESGGAAVRVKGHYQSVVVLPSAAYTQLVEFLKNNYLELCTELEPLLGVKAKEDLATSLVRVLHRHNLAENFLCDLIMVEVETLDNEHLMFRGNSLATKAMEAYMKLVAGTYLQETLSEFIASILESSDNLEVDPLRLSVSNGPQPQQQDEVVLNANQRLLTFYVEAAWGKIINSVYRFPYPLRKVFHSLRSRLELINRFELADMLVSSSVFLRLLCPAILSPSLFNLTAEFPSGPAARNLTLVAKTLQTLANFSKFGGKESYMEFMNAFVDREWEHMSQFLARISSTTTPMKRDVALDAGIDVAKELSLIHSYLRDALPENAEYQGIFGELHSCLSLLSAALTDAEHPLNRFGLRSTKASPITPPSDYENNAEAEQSNKNKAKGTPASDLNTSDDYVKSEALLAENMTLRQSGLQCQKSRARELVAGGRAADSLPYVDWSPGSDVKKKTTTTTTTTNGPVSSGYQSGANSTSGSSSSSSSSSPVDRDPLASSTPQMRAGPLAIANPLYSMQTVPLLLNSTTNPQSVGGGPTPRTNPRAVPTATGNRTNGLLFGRRLEETEEDEDEEEETDSEPSCSSLRVELSQMRLKVMGASQRLKEAENRERQLKKTLGEERQSKLDEFRRNGEVIEAQRREIDQLTRENRRLLATLADRRHPTAATVQDSGAAAARRNNNNKRTTPFLDESLSGLSSLSDEELVKTTDC